MLGNDRKTPLPQYKNGQATDEVKYSAVRVYCQASDCPCDLPFASRLHWIDINEIKCLYILRYDCVTQSFKMNDNDSELSDEEIVIVLGPPKRKFGRERYPNNL